MKLTSIHQLINSQQYFILKRDFLMRDEKHMEHLKNMNPEDPNLAVNYEIDDISFHRENFIDVSDELGISYFESDGTITEVKQNFYDDYLHPIIKSMSKNYIIQIEKKFDEKYFADPLQIKFFGEKTTNSLRTMVSNAEIASHLNSSTKKLISSVFSEIIDFVYENYIKASYTEKINFNLQKNEVVILFNLFLNNKIISDNNVHHFNEKLQKFFRYKEGKEFKDIVKAYKLYDELLGKNAQKSPKKALESLRKKFSDPNFFCL